MLDLFSGVIIGENVDRNSVLCQSGAEVPDDLFQRHSDGITKVNDRRLHDRMNAID
jgi:hypothetical protein